MNRDQLCYPIYPMFRRPSWYTISICIKFIENDELMWYHFVPIGYPATTNTRSVQCLISLACFIFRQQFVRGWNDLFQPKIINNNSESPQVTTNFLHHKVDPWKEYVVAEDQWSSTNNTFSKSLTGIHWRIMDTNLWSFVHWHSLIFSHLSCRTCIVLW